MKIVLSENVYEYYNIVRVLTKPEEKIYKRTEAINNYVIHINERKTL